MQSFTIRVFTYPKYLLFFCAISSPAIDLIPQYSGLYFPISSFTVFISMPVFIFDLEDNLYPVDVMLKIR